ncbi:hypothetical protein P7K49_039577, partial [Saguinus oedipus]
NPVLCRGSPYSIQSWAQFIPVTCPCWSWDKQMKQEGRLLRGFWGFQRKGIMGPP